MKKACPSKALAAAELRLVQAGTVANNPIYKPQPDPWIPIVFIPIVITPIGY